jgi:hypothetical protein
MKWLDHLLGRPPPDARAELEADRKVLNELHSTFDKVHGRSTRLERELRRVNIELRRQVHR